MQFFSDFKVILFDLFYFRTGSVVGSLASVESKGKPRSYPLWPEFNENDINAEKWV